MKQFILIILVLFFNSCSEGLPTEQMCLDKLKKKQNDRYKILFDYKDLKKTNGTKANVFGVDVYQMDYTVKKIAVQDIHEYVEFSMNYFCADTSAFYIDKGTLVSGIRMFKSPKFL